MGRLIDAAQQLTDQRTNRQFVGSFSGQLAAVDQSTAGQDNGVGTPTGQYQVRGQYGYAVEGRPQSQAQQTKQRQGIPWWVYVLGAVTTIAVFRK